MNHFAMKQNCLLTILQQEGGNSSTLTEDQELLLKEQKKELYYNASKLKTILKGEEAKEENGIYKL